MTPVQQLRTSGPQIPPGLKWLQDVVAEYRAILQDEPFYEIVETAETVKDFAWARHLLRHSRTFPDVLALRRDLHYDTPNAPTGFYGQHVKEEEGHADMLTDWLYHHDLIPAGETPQSPVATMATVACLSHCYTAAMTATIPENIVVLNVVTEAASHDFFTRIYPHLQRLDAEDEYWHLHTEADEFHSADGLAHLAPWEHELSDPDSPKGRDLTRWAREAAIFWGTMLNSWAGIDRWTPIPSQ